MDRLTIFTGECYESINPVDLALDEYSDINFEKIVDKLARYEDLEEQGRLLKLPCKVGDTVYCVYHRYTKCSEYEQEFEEYSCQGCEHLECDSHKEHYIQPQKAYSLDWIVTNLKRFDTSIFLTKSEAEAKLKELRGGENE